MLLLIKKMKISTYKLDSFFVGISFFVFVLLHVGVDINSVEDLPRYEVQFRDVAGAPITKIFDQIRTTDYFYAVFNRIVSYVSNDFVFFLLVYNLILFFSLFYVIKKYSPNYIISIVLILLFVYNQSLFVVRQYLALVIVILTIPYIFRKKLSVYLILCIVAFFTHSSSIVWIPIYFIYNIKDKKGFMVIMIVASLLIALLNSDLGRYLLIFGLDFENYIDTSSEVSLNAKLIRILYLALYFIFLRKHALEDGINKLTSITLSLLTVGYVFAPPIDIVGRMLLYYQVFLIFAIPLTMTYMRNWIFRVPYFIGILLFQGYLIMKGLEELYFVDYRYKGVDYTYIIIIVTTALALIAIYSNGVRYNVFKMKNNPKSHYNEKILNC